VVALTAALIGVCAVALATTWTIALQTGSSGEAHSQAAPAAPKGVTAVCTSGTAKTVKVSWTADPGAKNYTVADATVASTGPYTSIVTGQTGTSYTTAALTAGKSYWFEVLMVPTDAAWPSSPYSAPTSPARVISSGGCA
jgi:hypothetical protein